MSISIKNSINLTPTRFLFHNTSGDVHHLKSLTTFSHNLCVLCLEIMLINAMSPRRIVCFWRPFECSLPFQNNGPTLPFWINRALRRQSLNGHNLVNEKTGVFGILYRMLFSALSKFTKCRFIRIVEVGAWPTN